LGFLDGDGFLSEPVEKLARKLGVSYEKLERVRRKLVRLEPLGVGCVSAREFLELQIEELYPHLKSELKGALDELERGKRVRPELMEKLRRLRPKPLSGTGGAFKVVRVDAVIEEDGEELVVYLYEEFLELDVNEEYLELYRRSKGKLKGYLKEAFERYETLRRALELRTRNLRRILEKVVSVQEAFLKGKGTLKSLTAKEVARELGLHESTVSRIVNAKFVKTPVGTYPLKFFFVRESAGGLSQDELMRLIRELIENEDRARPLSDGEIARRLKAMGYEVARRTVAKYRELMGIPSSRERRLRG